MRCWFEKPDELANYLFVIDAINKDSYELMLDVDDPSDLACLKAVCFGRLCKIRYLQLNIRNSNKSWCRSINQFLAMIDPQKLLTIYLHARLPQRFPTVTIIDPSRNVTSFGTVGSEPLDLKAFTVLRCLQWTFFVNMEVVVPMGCDAKMFEERRVLHFFWPTQSSGSSTIDPSMRPNAIAYMPFDLYF